MTGQMRMTVLAWLATWLTASACHPLFEIKRFLVVGFVSSLVVAVVGARAAGIAGAMWLVLLGQVVALAEWVVVAYAAPQATLGFIPNPAAVRALAHLVSAGSTPRTGTPPRCQPDTGLVMMAAVGIAVIAILVDLLAGGAGARAAGGISRCWPSTPCRGSRPERRSRAAVRARRGRVHRLDRRAERERVSHWGNADRPWRPAVERRPARQRCTPGRWR
jgi:hypothetical protein